MPKWLLWVWTIPARRKMKNRGKVKAKALLRLAEMARPQERAMFLRFEHEHFVYGVPPSVKNLTHNEKMALLLDGENALIKPREIRLSVSTALKNARARAVRTGEFMPTNRELHFGV